MAQDNIARGMAGKVMGDASRVLAKSGAASTVTGTTSKTLMASALIPAGTVGPNGLIELHTFLSYTANTNSKTFSLEIGPNSSSTFVVRTHVRSSATVTMDAMLHFILRRGSTTTAVFPLAANANYGTGLNAAFVTGTVDFSVDNYLYYYGTLANSADSIALESYIVRITK